MLCTCALSPNLYLFQKQEFPAGYIVVAAFVKLVSGDQVVSQIVELFKKVITEEQNFVHFRGSSGALKEHTIASEDRSKFDKLK